MNFKISFFSVLVGLSFNAFSQTNVQIPFARQIWHENIGKTQRKIDRLDGSEDNKLTIKGNEEASNKATNALLTTVYELRTGIEADSTIDNNGKIKYLRGLNEVLSFFEISIRRERGAALSQLPELLNAFTEAMKLERAGASIVPLID